MKFAYCIAIAANFGISGSVRAEYRVIAENDDEAIELAKDKARERFLDTKLEVKGVSRGTNPI